VTSSANLRDVGNGDFLVTMADFLIACSADQIRMAPEKCMSPWIVKSELASHLLCFVLQRAVI
jgi:hypothetical protein